MQRTIARWQAKHDARAVFLSCYCLMTNNVLTAVQSAEFHDPAWVTELLHYFAGYYFAALEAYEKHDGSTPAVWQVAFASAEADKNKTLQLLLLGVNAHINYDLVLTLVDMLQPEWAALSAAQREQRYEDHCQVNAVIGRTIDAVQDDIIEPLAPGMDFVDAALGPFDEWATSHLIGRWREEVWQNALTWITAADSSAQQALRREIESKTMQRAEAVLLHNGLLSLRHLL